MIKTVFKQYLQILASQRYLLVLTILLGFLTIGFVTYVGIAVHPSELQLITHYSAFGDTHLYRSQWFYLFTFAGLGVMIFLLHTLLALKIYQVKGLSLAVLVLWVGISILLLAWVTSAAIINVWSPA